MLVELAALELVLVVGCVVAAATVVVVLSFFSGKK